MTMTTSIERTTTSQTLPLLRLDYHGLVMDYHGLVIPFRNKMKNYITHPSCELRFFLVG